MTVELWVDLFLCVVAVVVLAYIVSTIDIVLIHRRALKQREQQRVIDALRQSE